MDKKDYLLCYDISCQKRLAKVARLLEKNAIRIQFSIFFLPKTTKNELYYIAEDIIDIINPKEDDIRIYTIKDYGISMGLAYDLEKIFLIH